MNARSNVRMMAVELQPALEVITGPMFSGKSTKLIERFNRATYGEEMNPLMFKPKKDTRSPGEVISREGKIIKAIEIEHPEEILDHITDDNLFIAVDELQFFDRSIVPILVELSRSRRVIVSGLDLTFEEKPFETVAAILPYATRVTKRYAICMKCNRREASRSQRIVASSEEVLIGGKDTYEARCLHCFEPPNT